MEDEDALKVRVAVRIRPLLGREKGEDECVKCVSGDDGTQMIVIGPKKTFAFDYVLPYTTSQVEMFNTVALPLVDSTFAGYNASMLAYGQTGSGKTFTMGTGNIIGILNEQLGMIPRVAQKIFEYIRLSEGKRSFNLRASFIELYNEELKDLFDPTPKHIQVREDKTEGIKLVGASEKEINSFDDMMRLLEIGSLSRTTHSTAMNAVSSRSHAIFTCRIEQRTLGEGEADGASAATEGAADLDMMTSKFHFVDLAGSERLKRTGAEGARMQEGISINSGLLALGNVISALGDPNRKSNHVPYRDSRLTRLLQDSLGGNSRTLMIACVSPADSSFNESLNTLRYANRARNIKNKAVVNRDPTAMLIANLKKEVQSLKVELTAYRGGGPLPSTGSPDDQARIQELENQLNNEKRKNAELRQRLIKVVGERDCYALKLQEGVDEEVKADVLKRAQSQFMEEVVDSGPTVSASLSAAAQGSFKNNSVETDQLQTKILMMRSIMSREQVQRLAKMEEAVQQSPNTEQDTTMAGPTDSAAFIANGGVLSSGAVVAGGGPSGEMIGATPLSPPTVVKKILATAKPENPVEKVKNKHGMTQVPMAGDDEDDDGEGYAEAYQDRDGQGYDEGEPDPFDNEEIMDNDQMEHSMEIKIMDDQFQSLTSNIQIKKKVMHTYQEKMDKFAQMESQYTKDALNHRQNIGAAESRIRDVNKKLARAGLDKAEKERYTKEKKMLEKSLDSSNRQLNKVNRERDKLKQIASQSNRKIERLQSEVKMMKDQKIKLSRKMKDESVAWKKFKSEQRKEMIKLKLKLKNAEVKERELLSTTTKLKKSNKDLVTKEKKATYSAQTLKKALSGTNKKSRRNSFASFSAGRSFTLGRPKSVNFGETTSAGPGMGRSAVPDFVRWIKVGLANMVEDRAIERELEDQEESCVILEEKMGVLREALKAKKQKGFMVQVEIEDRLDTITAELEYRRQKIEDTKSTISGENIPVDFDDISISDARAIAKLSTHRLVDSYVENEELRTEIEELCEDLGQSQEALVALEGRVPLQELKMQQYKAELEAEHEQQLWFFMNQIESLKASVRQYELNQPMGATGQPQTEEQQEIWNAVQEVENMREQRYEDLLERNDYLSKLVAEQATITVQFTEAKAALSQADRMITDVLPSLASLTELAVVDMQNQVQAHQQETTTGRPSGPLEHRRSRNFSSPKVSGGIFDRLSNAETFTGMYKAINRDMHEKGVGHLGGQKSQKKKPKVKREAGEALMEEQGNLQGHSSSVHKAVATDSFVFTCSMDGTARSWDLGTKKCVSTYDHNKTQVRSMATIDNDTFMSVSDDKIVRVWDVRQGKCVHSSTALPSIPISIILAPDGKTFFTGHEDGTTSKWDISDFSKPVDSVRKHSSSVSALTFTPGHLVTGSRDRTLWLVNPDTFNFDKQLIHHHDSITTLACLKGNVVSGSRDRQIKLYSFDESGKDVGRFIFASHSDWVNVIVTSPDERYFVSGSKDSTIKVWDSESWELHAHLLRHVAAVNDLCWFKSQILISCAQDSTITVHRLVK